MDIIHETTGQRICQTCGTLLDETTIVSEITFQENANGSTSVIGQFIPASGPAKLSGISARHGPAGHSRESREITLQNAKRRLGQLTAALRLAPQNQEQALRIYQLAVQHNFVQGRKSQHVVAACLYVVCRREVKPHMLIDFAEVLQTNVFALGATVLQLLRALKLTIPLVDPSLYLVRFAHHLELGDYTHAVSQAALKIIAHMERDWMVTGRRPSGLCGAALLIAARMYNFRRSLKEVARVVRIGDDTLRKRLDEFQNSSAMDLSVEELERMDAEAIKKDLGGLDPPAFIKAQIADNVKRRIMQLVTTMPDLNHFIKQAPTVATKPDEAEDASIDPLNAKAGILQYGKLGPDQLESFNDPSVKVNILESQYTLARQPDAKPETALPLSEALQNPDTANAAEAALEKTALNSLESVNDILRQIRSVFSQNSELNDIYAALDKAYQSGEATELDHVLPEDEVQVVGPVKNNPAEGEGEPLKEPQKVPASKAELQPSSTGGQEQTAPSKGPSDFNDEKSDEQPQDLSTVADRYTGGLRAVLGTDLIDEPLLELVEAALSHRTIPLSKLVELRGDRTSPETLERDKEAERARQILKIRNDMEAWNKEKDIDTLSDVEDDEVKSVLLTEEESRKKEESWNAVYKDYIDAMERKRQLEEEQQKMGIRPARKNKNRRGALDVGLSLSSVEKRISERINYQALGTISRADPAVAAALSQCIPHTPNFRSSGSMTPLLKTPVTASIKAPAEATPSATAHSTSLLPQAATFKLEEFKLGEPAAGPFKPVKPPRPMSKVKPEIENTLKLQPKLSGDTPSFKALGGESFKLQATKAPTPRLSAEPPTDAMPPLSLPDLSQIKPSPSQGTPNTTSSSSSSSSMIIPPAPIITRSTTQPDDDDDTFGLGRKVKKPMGNLLAPTMFKRPQR